MGPEPRVALVVDNPLRDLAGSVLLGARLASSGVRVHLVPMNLQDNELRALAPDCVVLNYLRSSNERLARQLVEAGTAVVVADTEGGVLSSMDAYERTLTTDRNLRHSIAAYCSWGSTLAAEAVQRGWFLPRQVEVTGAARFDFYANPWRAAALAANPRLAPGGRPMVLVNGNFPVANPRFQSREQEANMLVDQFGWARSRVIEWQSTQETAMRELASLANDLAARHPDADVVYRPHPFERSQAYDDLLERRSNLQLAKHGGVDGWILRASVVIQRSCTTAIEAALSGVPTLSPRWIPTPFEMEAAEAVSIACADFAALDAYVSDALRGGRLETSTDDVLARTIDQWFHRVDGRSHERIASTICEHIDTRNRRDRREASAAIGELGPGPRQWLRSRARRWLPPSARRLQPGRRGPSWSSGEKAFSAPDVVTILNAIVTVEPRLGAITARRSTGDDLVRPFPFTRSVTVVRS